MRAIGVLLCATQALALDLKPRPTFGTSAFAAVSKHATNGVRSAVAAAVVAAAVGAPAYAVGPENIALNIKAYEEVACPPELAQGRAGGSLGAGASIGIAQKCVKVKAEATNTGKKAVPDAAVFGFVLSKEDGSSVVANNPDGRSDAGQFAMIDSVPPGKSEVEFVFVSQQNTKCRSTREFKCPIEGTEPLVELKFQGVKAISYPGGDRYKLYDECEQNEFAEGCS